MRIRKWEEIINPKTYNIKEKEGEKESTEPETQSFEKRKESIEEMFVKKEIKIEHLTNTERKMKLEDFNLKGEEEKWRIQRIRALAESYPFMFEKDFLENIKKIENRKKRKKRTVVT